VTAVYNHSAHAAISTTLLYGSARPARSIICGTLIALGYATFAIFGRPHLPTGSLNICGALRYSRLGQTRHTLA
jgi:hypothetical protein